MTEKKFNLKNPNEIYYQPFGEEEFKEDEFKKGYQKLGGLEGALGTIKEDPQNTQAIKYSGAVLFGNENFYFGTKISPRPALEEACSEGNKGLEKYFAKNENRILKKFESGDYKTLIQVVPLSKIEKEGESKTIVDSVNEYKATIESGKDLESKTKFVFGKVKSAPKYVANELARNSSNEAFINQLYKGYLNYAQYNVQEVLEKGDCQGAFKESLAGAKKKMEYYKPMAQMLYEKLSKKKE